MNGIIKNHILKHLSKFTKNLSTDKIHLSTLKGEGELANLELNENVLTEVLDLPTWLRISKATCNRLSIKIQWTKLKSQPICLFIDEIEVTMETCAEIRKPGDGSLLTDLGGSGGIYGLAEKIVDGMFISINSVNVSFKAPTFKASIQMSRIVIQSRTPTWENTNDLRLTRIKDELRGQILLFKEAEWQTLRIEANALASEDGGEQTISTPLRLIANQSKVRITMKKRLNDCSLVASRLLVSLDDLLWVLTDSQLKAALQFVNSLKEIIKKSSHQSKLLAAEKVKKQGYQAPTTMRQDSASDRLANERTGSKSQQAVAKLFNKYDIRETSYHLHTTRVDLHLCDDSEPEAGCRKRVQGGALQLALFKLCFDFYPFHKAGGSREHWLRYDENMASRHAWAQELLNTFRDEVQKVRAALSSSQLISPTSSLPTSTSRTFGIGSPGDQATQQRKDGPNSAAAQAKLQQNNVAAATKSQQNRSSNPSSKGSTNRDGFAGSNPGVTGSVTSSFGPSSQSTSSSLGGAPSLNAQSFQAARNTQLLENSVIVRLEDIAVYQVSSSRMSKNCQPKKLLSSDKKALCLPQQMSSLHVEFTDYYFPEGIDFPDLSRSLGKELRTRNIVAYFNVFQDQFLRFVPPANIYAVVNPLKLQMDYTTLLWLNAFFLNLQKSIDVLKSESPLLHVDIRLEALMPRVVLPAESEVVPEQLERPTGLQLQLSRLTVSNTRTGSKTSLAELKQAVHDQDQARLFHQKIVDFPRANNELQALPECIYHHMLSKDSPYLDKTIEEILLTARIPDSLSSYNMAQECVDDQWEILDKSKVTRSETVDSVSSVGLTYYTMRMDSLSKLASKDVWCIAVDQFWMEFIGAPCSPNRPQPFMESFPVTLWLFNPKQYTEQSDNSIDTLQEDSVETAFRNDLNSISQTDQLGQSAHYSKEINGPHNSPADKQAHCDNVRATSHENQVINQDALFPSTSMSGATPTNSYHLQEKTSDLHVLVKVGGKVNMQLSHYQFLFLMRLVDSLTNMWSEMKEDERAITGRPPAILAMALSLVVKEVELALICPPLADLPSPDTSEGGSSDLMLDDRGTAETEEPMYTDSALGTSNNTETSQIASSTLFEENTLINPLDRPGGIHPEFLLMSDAVNQSDKSSELMHSTSASQLSNKQNSSTTSSPLLTRYKVSSTSQLSDISQGTSHRPVAGDAGRKPIDLKKSLNSGLNSFTKSFGKITDKIKQTVRKDDDEDDWERESVRSASSDDEERMLLQFENRDELPTFDKHFNDLASEDEAVSLIHVSGQGDARHKGVVSIATFWLGGLEALVQLDGEDTTASATVAALRPEELGNVMLDKFQERFATDPHNFISGLLKLLRIHKTDIKESKELLDVEDPPIKLRFQQGPKAETFGEVAKERGYLELLVSGLQTTFGLASVTSLADLVEDEKHGLTMPMCVQLTDCFLTLQDARPPVNATSPGKVPMDLKISRLVLTRTEDGVYHIMGDTLPDDNNGPTEHYVRTSSVQTSPSLDQLPDRLAPGGGLARNNQPDVLLGPAASSRARGAGGAPGWRGDGAGGAELQAEVARLQAENDGLRRQLERIGATTRKLSSETGGISHEALQSLQSECESLRKRCHKLDGYRSEHHASLLEIARQADEMEAMRGEKHSLLTTIQMLQQELEDSENMRIRQQRERLGSGHH